MKWTLNDSDFFFFYIDMILIIRFQYCFREILRSYKINHPEAIKRANLKNSKFNIPLVKFLNVRLISKVSRSNHVFPRHFLRIYLCWFFALRLKYFWTMSVAVIINRISATAQKIWSFKRFNSALYCQDVCVPNGDNRR